MTNNYLVECIHRDYNKEIRTYIKNRLFHKEYTDDMVQEVYLKLLTLNNDKLIDLYFTTGVMNYIQRIVLNMFNNKSSPYYKMRMISTNEFNFDAIDEVEEDHRIKLIEKVFESCINEGGNAKFFAELYYDKLRRNLKMSQITKELNITKKVLNLRFKRINNQIKKTIDYESK
jgi:hypothetical protein